MKKLVQVFVMLAVLCGGSSLAPAWAAPTVGTPITLDKPVASPTGGSQNSASIAFDGTNYLVVWSDHRDLDTSWLYGARVDRSGKVLDPTGFRIVENADGPSVIFGGGQFLVTWMSNASTFSCARLDANGKLLDPSPIPLAQTTYTTASPGVAWNGTEFFVAWEDWRNNQADIYGARISKSGAPLDPAGIAIATAKGGHRAPKVASDGSGFLVTWMEDCRTGGRCTFAARVSGDGKLLDPQTSEVSSNAHDQYYPVVCFDGGNYQLAWEDIDSSGATANGMRGALVSPAGAVVAGNLVLSATSTDSSLASACSQGGALVAWRGGTTRVDATGRALDPGGLLVPPQTVYGVQPTVGSDGTNYLVVWQNTTTPNFVVGTTVSSSGTVAEANGHKLITTSNTQIRPTLVRGSNGYLAIWSDDRGTGGAALYGMPLDNTGTPSGTATLIDSSPSLLSTSDRVSAAWNGSHYLVVGKNINAGARLVRLDASGKPLASVTLPAAGNPGSPAAMGVASDGNGFLVVWEDVRTTPGAPPQPPPPVIHDIYAARIADDGTVLDASGFQIAGGTPTQTSPAAAFDGTNYLVVWVEDGTIRGIRVNKSGALVDSSSFLVGSGVSWTVPAVVWGKDSFLVTWLGSSGPLSRRLDATGKLLDGSQVPVTPDPPSLNIRSLHAAWNGQSFLVGWTGGDANGGVAMAARIGADGSLPDGNGFYVEPPVADEGYGQAGYPTTLGLAGDGSGHWLTLADKYDPSADVEVVRVRARLVTDCTGGQCPTLPDGGAPRPDGGPGDSASADAGKDGGSPDATIADAGADLAPSMEVAPTTDARASDASVSNDADASTIADAVPARDGALASPEVGGGDVATGGDAASPRDAGAPGDALAAGDAANRTKTKSSGCSCSTGGANRAQHSSTPWLFMGLCMALFACRANRPPRRK
jgi:hypothetical protein